MGDRSTIIITNGDSEQDITLYGHWGGKANLLATRAVLSQPDAGIGDYSRLSAQLFYEFAVNQCGYSGGLGFRILAGPSDIWTDNPAVIINVDTGEYCIEGEPTNYEFALPSVKERHQAQLIEENA